MNALNLPSDKQKELNKRMAQMGVLESDIEETFVRSSGPGGQKVNKVSTCVILLHRPTRARIKCQIARTQGLNRLAARHLLLAKIAATLRKRLEVQRSFAEKLRRIKRTRSYKAKMKLLASKSRRSAKKASRRYRADE